MYNKSNFDKALLKGGSNYDPSALLMLEAELALADAKFHEEDLLWRLKTNKINDLPNVETVNKLNPEYIYGYDTLMDACNAYGLKMVNTNTLSNVDYSAICDIKSIEKKKNIRLESFYALVPKNKLSAFNKPLFLTKLSDNTFYLLHKPTDDKTRINALVLKYTTKTIITAVLSCIVASLFAVTIPKFLANNYYSVAEVYDYLAQLGLMISIAVFLFTTAKITGLLKPYNFNLHAFKF